MAIQRYYTDDNQPRYRVRWLDVEFPRFGGHGLIRQRQLLLG